MQLASLIPTRGAQMDLIERLDAVREKWNLLEHPFYRRWSCGELRRDELAHYAGEYRHAVVALADTAAKSGNAEHAREEADHVALWDEFAAAFEADTSQDPSPETSECVIAWTAPGDRLEALAVMYAIEAGQPAVSKAKLDGLREHYGVAGRRAGGEVLRAPLGPRPRARCRVAPGAGVGCDRGRRGSPRRKGRGRAQGQLDPARRSRSREVPAAKRVSSSRSRCYWARCYRYPAR